MVYLSMSCWKQLQNKGGAMVLTVGEVAIDLKVRNETVYTLIRSGKLKAFRIGNRFRIMSEDLEKFKEEAKNETMS